jgi:hypothetical protein
MVPPQWRTGEVPAPDKRLDLFWRATSLLKDLHKIINVPGDGVIFHSICGHHAATSSSA